MVKAVSMTPEGKKNNNPTVDHAKASKCEYDVFPK